jgi:hypothetical protein
MFTYADFLKSETFQVCHRLEFGIQSKDQLITLGFSHSVSW